MNPLFFLGLSNYSSILNNIGNTPSSPIAIMAPCSVHIGGTDPGNITNVHYAMMHELKACSPTSINIEYAENYLAFGGGTLPSKNITFRGNNASVVRVMSCGDAVKASHGQLPSDLCSDVSNQMQQGGGGMVNDIGNSTAIFVFDFIAAGWPKLTPIQRSNITALLSNTVPEPLRTVQIIISS